MVGIILGNTNNGVFWPQIVIMTFGLNCDT